MALKISPAQTKAKILAIGASPRNAGNSDIILKHFCAGAEKYGVKTRDIQLRDCRISPCVGCELCRKSGKCSRFDDDMAAIYPQLVEARGLFLISPVHNYNITAWMKGFIDRLYCFYDFTEPRPNSWSSRLANQGRKAVVATVCEQTTVEDMGFALEAMQRPLEALGYEVIKTIPVLGVFAKGRIAENTNILADMEKQGQILARAISHSDD
ncbi:MAG: flavodoxin family protein [Desulfuromonadales bacterium]|nr:flavodoxin family protein [Desulfuromonadales bacterium]MBN2792516.1 flavodoxin family protein [Desulfuromonadales bacterium]